MSKNQLQPEAKVWTDGRSTVPKGTPVEKTMKALKVLFSAKVKIIDAYGRFIFRLGSCLWRMIALIDGEGEKMERRVHYRMEPWFIHSFICSVHSDSLAETALFIVDERSWSSNVEVLR
jgi:hypothetical protein